MIDEQSTRQAADSATQSRNHDLLKDEIEAAMLWPCWCDISSTLCLSCIELSQLKQRAREAGFDDLANELDVPEWSEVEAANDRLKECVGQVAL